jgi:hypothetical protein
MSVLIVVDSITATSGRQTADQLWVLMARLMRISTSNLRKERRKAHGYRHS